MVGMTDWLRHKNIGIGKEILHFFRKYAFFTL
jgi:hypothetical protein